MPYFTNGKKLKLKWCDIVLEEFIKGNRVYKDQKSIVCYEKLKPGITKYNVETIRELKEIQTDFLHIISVESVIIRFVEKYTKEKIRITGNIWQLIHAQKKTADYISVLMDALKKFKVNDKDIYDSLNENIESMRERTARNLEFTKEHMQQFGLNMLVDAVEKEYGQPVYGYIDQLREEYAVNTCKSKHEESFYKERDDFIYEAFDSFAKDHGIDIKRLIEEAEQLIINTIKEKKAASLKAKKQKMYEEKKAAADQLSNEDNTRIFQSIQNGNDRIYECQRLMEKIAAVGGRVRYLTLVKGSNVYYVTSEAAITKTLYHAALFSSKEDDRLNEIMAACGKNYPKNILTVQGIHIPKAWIPKIKIQNKAEIDPVEREVGLQEKTLYISLTDGDDLNAPYRCSEEFELMKNDGNLWGICLIKEHLYTVDSYWIPKGWTKEKGLLPSELTKSIIKIGWYHTEKEARDTVAELEADGMPDKTSAHVIHLESHGPYKLHKHIVNVTIKKSLQKMVSIMQTKEEEEINKRFPSVLQFVRFVDSVEKGPVCTIVSQECKEKYELKYLLNKTSYSSPNDLFDSHIKNISLVSSEDEESMAELKAFCHKMYEDYGYKRMYCIAEFAYYYKKYKARIVYIPWETEQPS